MAEPPSSPRIARVVIAALIAAGGAVTMTSACTYDYAGAVRCVNGVQDGDETGVDCGGSCVVSDGVVTTGLCPCENGKQDEGETGIDCGGPCVVTDGDVTTGQCPCENGVQDEGEADVDCGGDCGPCACVNGVQDEGETDIDCGGLCVGDANASDGGLCYYGDACAEQTDCDETVAVCDHGRCRPKLLTGKWTRLAAGKPEARMGARMSAHGASMVFTCGVHYGPTVEFDETWVFDEGVWNKRPSNVGARHFHAQALDPILDMVVIAGGIGSARRDDAWQRARDGTWTRIDDLPETVVGASLVHDGERLVLYGEATGDEVWTRESELDAPWVRQPTTGRAESKFYDSVVYDPVRREIVAFGGVPSSSVELLGTPETLVLDPETWEWTLRTVEGPHARWGAPIAFDVDRDRAVLFGGRYNDGTPGTIYDDTWEWDGATWSNIPCIGELPAESFHTTMAFDAPNHRMLLYVGGIVSYGSLGQTWELAMLGVPCGSKSDCAPSAFCADGLCCDTACDEGACNLRDSPGICTPP